MLQIRLSKAPASEGSGPVKPLPPETVTVACPDHLVLADLPVAKGIGAATATYLLKTVGRRSRCQLGERVHFCVQCDFPIAIYGRLSPCEHAFCLDCARSDSICYLCDERIQKIQTIKIMESILICAAPHCLKSFVKRADFEAHIQDTHAHLLRPNVEKEDGNDSEAQCVRQSVVSESTVRGPQKQVFPPGPNSLLHDRDDKLHLQQSREQAPLRASIQPRPPISGKILNHQSDLQAGPLTGIQHGFHQQNFDMQGTPQHPNQFPDRQQGVVPATQFPEYPTLHFMQPSNYAAPFNSNTMNPPLPFGYPPYPPEGAQPYFAPQFEMARQDSGSEVVTEQGPPFGLPPGYAPDQQWNAGMAGVPFTNGR